MGHLFDNVPECSNGCDDGGIPDGQPVTAEEVCISPLIVQSGTSRFIENMVTRKPAAINLGVIPYLLPYPDKIVTLLSTGKSPVWNHFFVPHIFALSVLHRFQQSHGHLVTITVFEYLWAFLQLDRSGACKAHHLIDFSILLV